MRPTRTETAVHGCFSAVSLVERMRMRVCVCPCPFKPFLLCQCGRTSCKGCETEIALFRILEEAKGQVEIYSTFGIAANTNRDFLLL